MSYLYSKLPETGVSPHIGTGEAILEFLLGGDADVAHYGAGELGKEALDEIEPGTVFGGESKFEAVRGLGGEPGSGLFGDMR